MSSRDASTPTPASLSPPGPSPLQQRLAGALQDQVQMAPLPTRSRLAPFARTVKLKTFVSNRPQGGVVAHIQITYYYSEMAVAYSWTFGEEGSGIYFVISYNGSEWSLEMLEGSMDLNALWFSDGDTIKEGDTTLVKQESSLNMNGAGSYDAEGNLIVWDDVEVSSLSGLGKEGTDKSTYLTEGETFDIGEYIDFDGNLADLTIGVRSTSVNGSDSIKLNAQAVELDEPVTGRIFVTSEEYVGILAYFDENGNGKLDASDFDYAATFGEGGNVDFSANSYIVEFLGRSKLDPVGADLVVDLSGFTDDDTIVVNFSRNWVGSSIADSTAATIQLGSGSYSFPGYTYNSYTKLVSSANMATRYQSKAALNGNLKVGITIKESSLSFGLQNYTSEGGVFIGNFFQREAVYQPLRLASWSSGTTIGKDQVSVVWPDSLATLGG